LEASENDGDNGHGDEVYFFAPSSANTREEHGQREKPMPINISTKNFNVGPHVVITHF